MKVWESSAPSNIALIKYMGKTDYLDNRPSNGSLSYTLENLRTFVTLEEISSKVDHWEPFEIEGLKVELDEKGKDRYLNFLSLLKEEFKVPQSFCVKSGNNFSSDCGLASSASSFAGLTMAFSEYLKSEKNISLSAQDQSKLSQKGSGSSCRSFFSPWSVWIDQGAEAVELPYSDLISLHVEISGEKKQVKSSEAHRRVLTSELFKGRPERASSRLEKLIDSLKTENWGDSYRICWAEFWDMHTLFETSSPSFGYMTSESVEVLKKVQGYWDKFSDGPIVTMDAGPNIHLLFRKNQQDLVTKFKQDILRNFKLKGLTDIK